jgi:hypothetical protein
MAMEKVPLNAISNVQKVTLKLRLDGPTTGVGGRQIGADLNALFAHYNTMLKRAKGDTDAARKIDSTTGPIV